MAGNETPFHPPARPGGGFGASRKGGGSLGPRWRRARPHSLSPLSHALSDAGDARSYTAGENHHLRSPGPAAALQLARPTWMPHLHICPQPRLSIKFPFLLPGQPAEEEEEEEEEGVKMGSLFR